MSVELQEQRTVYQGNGASVFAFEFTIEDADQISVVRADATGQESVLTQGTDYTVAINEEGTGSVTLIDALPYGWKLALISAIPATQERSFPNNSPYYQEQIEGGLDKNTRLIQQLEERVARSAKLPVTDQRTPEQYAQELFDAHEEVMGMPARLEAQLVSIGDRYVLRLGEQVVALLGSANAFNGAAVVTVLEDMPAGATIELPDLLRYSVGSNALMVSYNGTVAYAGQQYVELGTIGSVSNAVTMRHELRAGDMLQFRVIALHDHPITANGTTTPRNLSERFADVINVKDFGAVGDGVADDTAAIQAACQRGGAIVFPSGMYRISEAIDIAEGSALEGSGATILCDADTHVFRVVGAGLSAGVALGANVTRGDTDITTAQPHGLAVGDIALIWGQRNCLSVTDAADWCLGPHEGMTAYFAEPVSVRSVTSATSFTSSTPLIFPDYRTDASLETESARAGTTVHKVSFIERVSISGLTIEHHGKGSCIFAQWAKDLSVSDVTIRRGTKPGISIAVGYCYNFTSRDIAIYGDPSLQVTVEDSDFHLYGPVDVSSSWFFSADRWTMHHTVTGMDTTFVEGRWPSIGSSFTNSYVKGNSSIGASSHPGCFGYTYIGNTFEGCAEGLVLRSRGAIVTNNRLISSQNTDKQHIGIYVFGAAGDSIVANNYIEGYYYGIADHPYSSGHFIPSTGFRLYSGNVVKDSTIGFIAFQGQGDNTSLSNIEVSNNAFYYTLHAVWLQRWRHGVDVNHNFCTGRNATSQAVYVSAESTRHTFFKNRFIDVGSSNSVYVVTPCEDATKFPWGVADFNGCKVGYDDVFDFSCKYINGASYATPSRFFDKLRIGSMKTERAHSWPADCLLAVEGEDNSLIGMGVTGSSGFLGLLFYDASNAKLGSYQFALQNSTHRFGFKDGENAIYMANNSIYPSTDAKASVGWSGRRWAELFASTGSINTSDAREKTSVTDPHEALMRAWGKVNFKAFQFTDAVEKKGEDEARIHFGVIAQQVAEAFASEGLDASRYALFCYDKWDDEWEEQEDGTKILVTPAGDRYGIRYSEALALECAYQRWLGEKREQRIAALEAKIGGNN